MRRNHTGVGIFAKCVRHDCEFGCGLSLDLEMFEFDLGVDGYC